MKTCIVPECVSPQRFCRGMCARHYFRWKSSGTPLPEAPYAQLTAAECPEKVLVDPEDRSRVTQAEQPCVVPSCPDLGACRGLCRRHQAKWRRTGAPMPEPPYRPLLVTECPPEVLVDGRRRRTGLPRPGRPERALPARCQPPAEFPDTYSAEARASRPLHRPTIDATASSSAAMDRDAVDRVLAAVRALYAAPWGSQWVGSDDHPTREDIVDGELERAAAVAGLLPGGGG